MGKFKVDAHTGRNLAGHPTKVRMQHDADRAYRELIEIAQLAGDITMEEMVRAQRALFLKAINKSKVAMA